MKNYANSARTDGKLFSLTQSRYLKVCLKNRAKIELYQFFHRSEQKFKIPILVIQFNKYNRGFMRQREEIKFTEFNSFQNENKDIILIDAQITF